MKKNSFNEGIYFIKKPKKLLLTMKLTVLLSLICLLPSIASVYSQEEKITLDIDNKAIKEVLREIEMVSEYRFFFSDDLLPLDERVNLKVKNEKVNEVLENILTSRSLSYQLVNNNLVLIVPDNYLQEITIKGKVTDMDGNPLPGVNIVEKGTTNGAVSDLDGNYTINLSSPDAVLVFSFVGFLKEEINVGEQTLINVTLIEDIQSLEEVVVIGYGTQKKSDVTGSVSSVQSEDIVRSNPVQAVQSLQGQVSGVSITRGTNKPGSDFDINIRGLSSIDKSNSPLVVIDGLIGGRLNSLNPSDIKSIDVLKDASATAIYGSRGGNGVIIVTTKKGESGKPMFTYETYGGVKVPAHLPDMMTAQEFYQAYAIDVPMDGGSIGNPFTENELAIIESGESTDWVDLITDPGLQTSHTISVAGGNEFTTYHVSGGYLKEEGNLKETNYDRYNMKLSVDSKPNDLIKFGVSAYYNYSIRNIGSNEAIRSAYRARPTGTVYYDDLVTPQVNNDINFNGYAIWMGINDKQVLNPLVEADPENFNDETRNSNILANGYLELTPITGLSIKSAISTSVFNSRFGQFRGTYTKSQNATKDPMAYNETEQNASYTWDNIMNYKATIASNHNLNLTGLFSMYLERNETMNSRVDGLPYNSYWYALGTGENIIDFNTGLTERSLMSYMGRVNYDYNQKYLVTLTGRWDGSSVLSEENKWGFFPSAAVAWRMSEESFIQDLGWFDYLKLRLSYGLVGNDVVAPYQTQARLINTAYDFDGAQAYGFAPASISNEDLSWEKSKEINLGLDMNFVGNRISTNIEIYKRNTVDLILNQKLPSSYGFDNITSNIGEVLNQGIEVTLNTINISTSDFKWSTSINFSTNHNEILELYGGGITEDKGNAWFVGESLRSNYYYEFDGIWQLTEADEAAAYGQEPGSVKVVDQNGDGVISSADDATTPEDEDDRIVLGSELPKWFGGITNKFSYKNWDLSFFVYTRQGGQFRSQLLQGTFGELGSARYNRLDLNYWTSQNPTNDYFGLVASNPYRQAIQYEDASFVRVNDITIGYTLPQSVQNAIKASNFRIYAQVYNPFVFTDFHAIDPEVNSGMYSEDVSFVTYLVGINVSF